MQAVGPKKEKKRKQRLLLVGGVIAFYLALQVHLLYEPIEPLQQTALVGVARTSNNTKTTQSRVSTTTTVKSTHNPRRFSSQPPNWTNHAQRGWNVLNTLSGCRMAAWAYCSVVKRQPLKDDCMSETNIKKLRWKASFEKVQEYDTIYVPYVQMPNFVHRFLPNNTVPNLVILSGQQQKILLPGENQIQKRLLQDDNILHWFTQNLDWAGGSDLDHPKVSD